MSCIYSSSITRQICAWYVREKNLENEKRIWEWQPAALTSMGGYFFSVGVQFLSSYLTVYPSHQRQTERNEYYCNISDDVMCDTFAIIWTKMASIGLCV